MMTNTFRTGQARDLSATYAHKAGLIVRTAAATSRPPFPADPSPFRSIESAADQAREYARIAVTAARDAGLVGPD